jgi:hypothetical protein
MQRRMAASDERAPHDDPYEEEDARGQEEEGSMRTGGLCGRYASLLSPSYLRGPWEAMGPPRLDLLAPTRCGPLKPFMFFEPTHACAPFVALRSEYFEEHHTWRTPPDEWGALPVGIARDADRPQPGAPPAVHMGASRRAAA